MNSFSRGNLQEFCRTCFTSIVEKSSFSGNGNEATKYDLSLMPQLRKLLTILTSVDNFSSDYPQNLCKLCHEKLQGIQEFRRMAQETTEKIEDLLKTPNSLMTNNSSSTSNNQIINNDDCPSDYDNKLLLPELAVQLSPTFVKSEPLNIVESTDESSSKRSNEIVVKEELHFDNEQDDSNCRFYEHNDSNNTQDSCSPNEHQDDMRAFRNELFFSASFQTVRKSKSKSKSKSNTKSGASKPTSHKRDRNKKSLKCPRCDKQVYKKVYLDAHIRAIHEGHEKPFLCSECQKSFTRYNQLHAHIQTNHTVAIKFVCGVAGCAATFKMNKTLETHRRVVHTEEQPAPTVELNQIIAMHQQQLVHEWELEHFCKQCKKKYSSKRALSEHLKRHSQIKDHVCNVCGAAKVTRTELITHMRTHESNLEKFKCTLCPQEFNHKNAISRHIRVVHEGERRFICSHCPRRFGTRHAQISHERLHTGERPFKCNSCKKGFAQIEGLKSHMKNHDKSLRKHVCKHCSQRFITRKNLIDHEQRHLGSKPHICVVCSRGFFNRIDLDLHSKLHEEESENDGEYKPAAKKLKMPSKNEGPARNLRTNRKTISLTEENIHNESEEEENVLRVEQNDDLSNHQADKDENEVTE